MARKAFVARKSFYPLKDEKFKVRQENAARKAARDIRIKAQALADKPSSPMAKGVNTSRLHNSIKVGEWTWSPSKRTYGIQVYVDLPMTPTENGTSYAIFQERGTGIYGRYKRPIKARESRFMVWMQTGKAYRGSRVRAKKLGSVNLVIRRPFKRTVRKTENIYKQYAEEVKGSPAKRFWSRATNDKGIKDKLKTDLKAITEKHLASITRGQEK